MTTAEDGHLLMNDARALLYTTDAGHTTTTIARALDGTPRADGTIFATCGSFLYIRTDKKIKKIKQAARNAYAVLYGLWVHCIKSIPSPSRLRRIPPSTTKTITTTGAKRLCLDVIHLYMSYNIFTCIMCNIRITTNIILYTKYAGTI